MPAHGGHRGCLVAGSAGQQVQLQGRRCWCWFFGCEGDADELGAIFMQAAHAVRLMFVLRDGHMDFMPNDGVGILVDES